MSNSDVIAASAVVVAVLALFATIWQAWLSRKHSRLSVRPHLDFHESRTSSAPFSLTLVNNGLGPALIEIVHVTMGGNVHTTLDRVYGTRFTSLVSTFSDDCHFKTIEPPVPLAAGQQIELFSINIDIDNDTKLLSATRFMNTFGATVSYRSMYDERFSITRATR